MASLQTDAVHYFQRPDASLPLDSNRTVLGGNAEEFRFGKVGGRTLMFESSYQRRSAGFEINDLGFLRRADQQSWNTWAGFFDRREHLFYKRFQFNNNWWQYWTTDGLPLEAAYNTNTHITFKNNWGWHMGGTARPARHDLRRSCVRAAARRCDRARISRPGCRSMATIVARWCRT